MQKIKEFIDKSTAGLGIQRDKILPFAIAVVVTTVIFLDSAYFENRLLYILAIVAIFVVASAIAWIAVKAGFTVLKSFFLLSAELSLLFLLADSYCKARAFATAGDDALRSLMVLGIMYVSYRFYVELKKALKDRLNQIPEKRWSKEKVFVVGVFLFYTGLFIYIIFQVVEPIVLNLCVF